MGVFGIILLLAGIIVVHRVRTKLVEKLKVIQE